MHLFLSPHCDDAALSCGGQIAQLTTSGAEVRLLTVMAGQPHTPRLSPFVRAIHRRWNVGSTPMTVRRAEDQAASALLGASISFGPYLDALYRVDPGTGDSLYPTLAALFGPPPPADELIAQPLVLPEPLRPGDVIHAPLGIGQHIDHLIVRDMALALMQAQPDTALYFYADFPYTRQGHAALHAAIAALGLPLTRVIQPIGAAALDAKIAAIGCYRSQLSMLGWTSAALLAAEVRAAIANDGGECEWQLTPADEHR